MTHVKIKDFWIFSIFFNKLLASNSKEFWIFHLKYFSSPVNDLYQNRISGFFQNSIDLTFCIKIKDFWIISLENFFSPEITTHVGIKDFWIFFKILSIKLLASNSRIFGFSQMKYFFSQVNDFCQNKGFLDFFKILSIKFLASNSRIFGFFHLEYFLVQRMTYVRIKDYCIVPNSTFFTLCIKLRDFWILLLKYFFIPVNYSCRNEGFLDF